MVLVCISRLQYHTVCIIMILLVVRLSLLILYPIAIYLYTTLPIRYMIVICPLNAYSGLLCYALGYS